MNYRQALEIQKDGNPTGKYHYTNTNDDRTYPIGYCRDGCPGHDTPEDAQEHYKQYLLNENLRLDAHKLHNMKLKCEAKDGCEEYTDTAASVGGIKHYHLCNKHRTKEEVAKLLVVGQEISSY